MVPLSIKKPEHLDVIFPVFFFFFFKCHHVEHLVQKDTKMTQLNIYSARSREIVATSISALC